MKLEDHAIFCDGYFDAIGRLYSTNEELVAPCVRILSAEDTIKTITGTTDYNTFEIENFEAAFEKEIGTFLGAEPTERHLFYLTDYLSWFTKYNDGYKCRKYRLTGTDTPDKYLAYVISFSEETEVLIYVYKKAKR